jgi:hypothetical protein
MTGTAVATRPQPPSPPAGKVAAIVPRTLEEAFRVATALSMRPHGPAPAWSSPSRSWWRSWPAPNSASRHSSRCSPSRSSTAARDLGRWPGGRGSVARLQGQGMAGGRRRCHDGPVRGDPAGHGEVIGRPSASPDAKKANLWGKAGPWQSYPRGCSRCGPGPSRSATARRRAARLPDQGRGRGLRRPINRDPPAQAGVHGNRYARPAGGQRGGRLRREKNVDVAGEQLEGSARRSTTSRPRSTRSTRRRARS